MGEDPIVSAFHAALLHQLLWLLALATVGIVVFQGLRLVQYRRVTAGGERRDRSPWGQADPEPPARQVLRYGFGLLWLLDGLLLVQASMPESLATRVVAPAAVGSPGWLGHLVHAGATVWTNHPAEAAAAVVWIELGLGLWLLVAPRGRWSRIGGLAAMAWALVVWVLGEAAGGLFAPGTSWLLGVPGAALFYAVGGLLLALPERAYRTARLGRALLVGLGAFLLAMAVLQAWPGRGSWQGRVGTTGRLGPLAAAVHRVSAGHPTGVLGRWQSSFSGFDAAHGWAVNLVVVAVLAVAGAACCSRRRRAAAAGLAAVAVLALADWLLVEDLGVLGGVGTNPGAMVPLLLLAAGGYVAAFHVPRPAPVAAAAPAPPAVGSSWWERTSPSVIGRTVGAAVAVAVVAVGLAPLALAATDPYADAVVSEASNGLPSAVDTAAPPFRLVDQDGSTVSLAGLRGHVVALTFLDPVCTTDCPLIAQEFHQADERLGPAGRRVDFVAIVANPIYRSPAFVRAFDQQEGLDHVANWYYLTGSAAQLRSVWASYGVPVVNEAPGAMIDHTDVAYVIDARGRERVALSADPQSGSATSSLGSELVDQLDRFVG